MKKINVALVLIASTHLASAAEPRVPAKLRGEWCLVEGAPGTILGTYIYARKARIDCNDSDRWMSLGADGMYAHELQCKLVHTSFIPKKKAHLTRFWCVGYTKEGWTTNFWLSVDKHGGLTMMETGGPPME